MKEQILSAGIDIGTSTTQLIFSRLTIVNLASSYTVPRISIVDKEVIYRSSIYFTPLKSQTEIDAEKVREIIRKEYEKAGMKPENLKTGAVIITGGDGPESRMPTASWRHSATWPAILWLQRRGRIWSRCFPAGVQVQTGSRKKNGKWWLISISVAEPATLHFSRRERSEGQAVWILADG